MLLEIHNFLRRLVVVEKAEIIFVQIANEFAVFVHRNKKDIHFVNAFLNGDDRRIGGIDSGRSHGKPAARSDIRSLSSRRQRGSRQRHRETKNVGYVLHSQTVQKLHKPPLAGTASGF